MAELTFDEIVEAAVKLPYAQKQKLVDALRGRSLRDEIIADTDRLRASGAYERSESLSGRFARHHNLSVEDGSDDE